jgi:hypothetical protein
MDAMLWEQSDEFGRACAALHVGERSPRKDHLAAFNTANDLAHGVPDLDHGPRESPRDRQGRSENHASPARYDARRNCDRRRRLYDLATQGSKRICGSRLFRVPDDVTEEDVSDANIDPPPRWTPHAETAQTVLPVGNARTSPRSSFSQSAHLVITSRRRSTAVILR